MKMSQWVVLFLVLANISCASYFKRKACEKTNWFEYGKKVALNGERLSSDQFYGQCLSVNAEFNQGVADQGFKEGMEKYCEINTAFEYGAEGKFYKFTFCDSPHEGKMRSLHAKGVKEYCRPSNSFSQGKKGTPYNNICPKDLEARFLVGFNKGRIRFLQAEISANEGKITNLNKKASQARSRIRSLQRSIRWLPKTKITTYEKDETGTLQKVVKEPDSVARKRQHLNNSIDNAENELHSAERQVETHRNKIIELNKEISLLR